MAMTASAIRFEPNEKEWIAAFAEMERFHVFRASAPVDARKRLARTNLTLGTFLRAIEEDDGTRISWSKVKSDLGLAI